MPNISWCAVKGKGEKVLPKKKVEIPDEKILKIRAGPVSMI